jgi:dTDP-4-dehydrorhamnose reductase
MKILIIGSKGMAGHVIYNYFKENSNFEIVDIARGIEFHTPTYQLDISDFEALTTILKLEKPTFVINCIGVLNQYAENHPDNAVLLNSYLPHFLAKNGDELDYKLIHISTDCVFSGKEGDYKEDSIKNGLGFYATTKALGEVSYGKHITLRTSIVGPELKDNGIGLLDWFLNQKGHIIGYSRAFWTGITTLEMAKAIFEVVKQNISGLHHLVNNQKINKSDLLKIFKETFEKNDIEIISNGDYFVDKSLIRTNFDFNYRVGDYDVMMQELKDWILSHPNLYNYLQE